MESNPRIPFILSSDRATLPPLNGKSLIVNVALNVEHWPFDAPMPRAVLPPPHGTVVVPDVPNFSWVEYGLRCGVPRILEAMTVRGLRGSVLLNASVADVYPSLADALVSADWEILGHGWSQRSLQKEKDEKAVIQRSLERLRRLTGRPARGWLSPGLAETNSTADLLKAAGIEYVHEWIVDDLPCWMHTKHGPLMALPYTVELNDVPIYAVEKLPSNEMLLRVEATLAQFETELPLQPRVMTLALHPHLIGVPHRMHFFGRILDLLLARDDVIFVTSGEVAEWYQAVEPAPSDF